MFTAAIFVMFAVVTAIIGTWLYLEQNKGVGTFVITVLLLICAVSNSVYTVKNQAVKAREEYNAMVAQKDAEIEKVKEQYVDNAFWKEDYCVPAELNKQVEQENGTYKVIFVVASKLYYEWIADYEYPEDIPYMLTMDGNDTPDFEDDKILVVWADMN